METLQTFIDFKARVDAIHDGLFFAVLAVFVGGVVYLWRRFAPSSFESLPPVLQHFPAVVLGALGGALSTGMDPIAALAGAFAGLSSIGGHHALKASPLPYGGKPKAKGTTTLIALVLLALLSTGCAGTFEENRIAGANDVKLGAAQGSPERCADLSDAKDTFSLLGKIGAGIGTTGALAPIHEGIRESDVGRWVSMGVAAGGALLAGVGLYGADLKGAAYVRECQ